MIASSRASWLSAAAGEKSRNGRGRGNGRRTFAGTGPGSRWQRRFTPAATRSQTETTRPCELAVKTRTKPTQELRFCCSYGRTEQTGSQLPRLGASGSGHEIPWGLVGYLGVGQVLNSMEMWRFACAGNGIYSALRSGRLGWCAPHSPPSWSWHWPNVTAWTSAEWREGRGVDRTTTGRGRGAGVTSERRLLVEGKKGLLEDGVHVSC